MGFPAFLQLHNRLVFVLAVVSVGLFWIFLWSWQEDISEPQLTTIPVPVSVSATDPPTIVSESMVDPSFVNGTLCDVDSYNNGEWKYRPLDIEHLTQKTLEKAVGYTCPAHFPHKCYMRNSAKELLRAKSLVDYSWQPSSCSILSFDSEAFSKHLSKHPLLFVGDSITQLQYESLNCLIGAHLTSPSNRATVNGGDKSAKTYQRRYNKATPEDSPISMAYIRADYLIRLDDFKLIAPFEDEGDQMGIGNNFPWVHALPDFDYIVINTAAHWHPGLKWGPHRSEAELLVAFKEAMSVIFNHLKETIKPHQTVWFRSTPYGHAKCSQYTKPQTVPVAPTGQPGEYEWHMFEIFDTVWRDWIIEQDDSRFQFLNAYAANKRGETHAHPDKDCLHTCIPGPVDDWNRLLFHEIAKKTSRS